MQKGSHSKRLQGPCGCTVTMAPHHHPTGCLVPLLLLTSFSWAAAFPYKAGAGPASWWATMMSTLSPGLMMNCWMTFFMTRVQLPAKQASLYGEREGAVCQLLLFPCLGKAEWYLPCLEKSRFIEASTTQWLSHRQQKFYYLWVPVMCQTLW